MSIPHTNEPSVACLCPTKMKGSGNHKRGTMISNGVRGRTALASRPDANPRRVPLRLSQKSHGMTDNSVASHGTVGFLMNGKLEG